MRIKPTKDDGPDRGAPKANGPTDEERPAGFSHEDAFERPRVPPDPPGEVLREAIYGIDFVRAFLPSSRPTPLAAAAAEAASATLATHLRFDAPNPRGALVFVPGAKVQEEAYAPLAAALAERGVSTAIVRAPLDLPFLLPLRRDRISAAERDLRAQAGSVPTWVGGHSAGGVIADRLLEGGDFEGLVLVGSRIEGDANPDVRGVAVFGDQDGLISHRERGETRRARPGLRAVVAPGDHDFRQSLWGDQAGDTDTAGSGLAQVNAFADAIVEGLCEAR